MGKPNMVKNGLEAPTEPHAKVAAATINALQASVPNENPGIFFLSGETKLDEDNEETATLNLNEMNKTYSSLPWHLSFSYGKALRQVAQRVADRPGEGTAFRLGDRRVREQLGRLRGHLPAVRTRADRRAGDRAERQARHRGVRGGHQEGAQGTVRSARVAQSRSGGRRPQAE